MTTRPASTADPIPGAQPMPGERTVLDPTGERSEAIRELSARPPSLVGITVGLLDISKPRGNVFLDRIEAAFEERGISTKRYRKPTFTKPAHPDLRAEIARECGAIVEALAD